MESKTLSLSSGFHAAADVVIATLAGLIAVVVCYPIYALAAVIKFLRKAANPSRHGRSAPQETGSQPAQMTPQTRTH
jgi:hypothetical protein